MIKDLTDITLVIDRSGSMQATKDDAQKGVNGFIDTQRKEPGRTLITLVQFDTGYEVVHNGVDCESVPHYELVPRAGTALLDAVGRAIVETGGRLKNTPEGQRPGLVVFVILTDGEENASREYTLAKIKEMITHQQDVYKWQFTFIGANQDAFSVAGGMGIPQGAALNYAEEKTSGAFAGAMRNVSRMKLASAGGRSVCNSYTDEERDDAK